MDSGSKLGGWLFQELGHPSSNLFAAAENAKLTVFCIRTFHLKACGVDALSLSWLALDAYAFLPFAIIHWVLLKDRAFRTRVMLVATIWPRQPWFPLLLHLLVNLPVELPPAPRLVSQDKGRVMHPRVQDILPGGCPELSQSLGNSRRCCLHSQISKETHNRPHFCF